MRRFALLVGVVLVATGAAFGARAAQDAPEKTAAENLSGLHDFDFLFGEWRVHSRRLKERLTGR